MKLRKFLADLWDFLVEPWQKIPEIKAHQDARLAAALFLVIILLSLAQVSIFSRLPFIVLFALAGGYFLTRTRYYLWAVSLLITVLCWAPFNSVITQAHFSLYEVTAHFSWIAVPIIFAGLFFSLPGVFLVGGLSTVALAVMPSLIPGMQQLSASAALGLTLTLTFVDAWVTWQRDQTERLRRAELHSSQELLRLAVQGGGVGLWSWEVDSGKLVWSTEVETMFGLSPGGFSGRFADYLAMVYPDDRPVLEKTIQLALTDQKFEYLVEHRILTPEGEVLWLEGRGEVFRDAAGKPVRMAGTLVNVTQRKEAELTVIEQERFLDNLTSALPNVIYIFNPQTNRNTYVNRHVGEAIGYSPNEIDAAEDSVFMMHPDDRLRMAAHMQNVANDMQNGWHEFEYRMQNKNGEWRWFTSRDRVLQRTPDGVVVEILGSALDITGRKRAEAEVYEGKQLLESINQAVPSVLYIFNLPERRSVYRNFNIAQALGYSPDEVDAMGSNFLPLLRHPDEAELHDRHLAALAADRDGLIYEIEYRMRHKNGEWRWFAGRDTVYRRLDDGSVIEIIGSALDITERKQAEQEILDLNEQLEQRVEARTQELAAANRELEAFAFSISHDLRSPLRGIDGYAHLLEMELGEGLNPEGRDLLHNIQLYTEKMSLLIDQVLHFSRLSRQPMQLAVVDMSALVEQIAQSLRFQEHPERDIEFKVEDLPDADADGGLIEQVWINLISNALKYTRTKARAVIHITAQKLPGEVVYCVQDNGVGFDMQYADQLFGVFRRLHSNEQFEGTGIGLANVRRIVERHHGRVWAQAATNEGASFYFSLPAHA
jgi:PAS domain S-box-containing protein